MALFDCTCDAVSGHARALTYTTAHGDFHTPMFMPVGTSATVKGITTDQLRELGSQVVLANTYHLAMRPGAELVAEAGGIHRFMNYDEMCIRDSPTIVQNGLGITKHRRLAPLGRLFPSFF